MKLEGILLGYLFDNNLVDKVIAFLAPKIIGGENASVVAGRGIEKIADCKRLKNIKFEHVGEDFMITGYVVN